MSDSTWQSNFAGDPSLVGSTFWINTKPVTIAGLAPESFYGDRMSSTPPDFYLPIESMPLLANAPYVHRPESQWLYLVGRIKPGVHLLWKKTQRAGEAVICADQNLFLGG
jgi:macrolide transport system ATP-binding/permease protein